MDGDDDRADVQEQLDELRRRVDVNHDALKELVAAGRLDRADIDALRAENEVDREIIATLAAEGMIAREHVRQLQEALVTARRIGAAIGIVMAAGKLSEEDAFLVLRGASQHSNRKLRDLADDIVRTGDVSDL